MGNYKDTFRKAILLRNYNRNLRKWSELPFLKRLFTRKPRAPFKGDAIATNEAAAAKAFHEEASRALLNNYEETTPYGEIFATSVYYNAEPGHDNLMPVLIGRYFDGSCWFVERTLIRHDGSVKQWGVDYPYSECGVTGLPQEDALPEKFRQPLRDFRRALDELRDMVRENADIL